METLLQQFELGKDAEIDFDVCTKVIGEVRGCLFTKIFQRQINDAQLTIYSSLEGKYEEIKYTVLKNDETTKLFIDINFQLTKGTLVFDRKTIKSIEDNISKILGITNNLLHTYPLGTSIKRLHRKDRLSPYSLTGDNRLIEYDWTEVVFEKKTQFQLVQVVNSKQFGNCLVLDNDPNLAESDTIYTLTLTGINRGLDYSNKNVLILGGGDGGILAQLKKLPGNKKPKFITMVEIDIETIEGARKFMRKTCFDAMDKMKSDEHEIIVGNCFDYLLDAISNNHKFDVIINDLTEFPYQVEQEACESYRKNKNKESAYECLPDNGILLSRGDCAGAKNFHTKFAKDISILKGELHQYPTMVPSFMEYYILYEVRKTNVS
ncbi:hypothetical protein SNEBB_006797 [Seison nebaliae]|nr:hypothetical protein SNEBB_006797 [Seison nebaliae]